MEELTKGQIEAIKKYLEVLYKPDSDLQHQYPDVIERRKAVAKQYLANFNLEQVDIIIYFKDVKLVDMLMEHLRNTYSMEYTAMVTTEHQFYSFNKAMYEPLDELDADKKLKAIDTQEKISRSLPEIISRYKGLKKIVYSGVEENEIQQITKRTVEQYAKVQAKS
jgi:hypothetical protein